MDDPEDVRVIFDSQNTLASASPERPSSRHHHTGLHCSPVRWNLGALALVDMRVLRGVLLVPMLLLWTLSARAQPEGGGIQAKPQTRAEILEQARERKSEQLEPYRISGAERWVQFLETWRLPRRLFTKGFGGFRPVVGGMPSGAGFVGGGGYITGYNSQLLQFTANARYSTRAYTAYDARLLILPRSTSLSPVQGHITWSQRDFGSPRFFGLGPESSRSDRTTYRLKDQTIKLGVDAWVGRVAELGASVGWLTSEPGPGSSSSSLEERFDPRSIPGFGVETDYLVYGGHAVVRFLEESVAPSVGVTLGVDIERYDDTDADRYDFTRVVADVQAHIPLGHRNRILALHLRSSQSTGDRGGIVPFHLMETIGGANSIRGFREYRFRDSRNLFVNAEYRWEVWTYLDLALFYDAGKVFSDVDDFGFSDLKSGYGFGLRGHGPTGMVLRFDFARSDEGFILHIGSGPSF